MQFRLFLLTVEFQLCEKNFILLRYIVPGYTDRLQPQDLGINRSFKAQIAEAMVIHFEQELEKWEKEHGLLEPVGFEKKLQKGRIGGAVVGAVIAADTWLKSDAGKVARELAFRRFECCWEPLYQAKARAARLAGGLFDRPPGARARGEEVLEILLHVSCLSCVGLLY